MTPAVATVPQATGDEGSHMCSRCLGDLADTALRCSNCRGFTHLRCSELPAYQLVRFSLSQAAFMCTTCVKTKDAEDDSEKYDSECTKVTEIMAKELSILEKREDRDNDDTQETGETVQNNQTKLKPKICFQYINRKCKFGPKGEGCKYDHPKICRFYTKSGDKKGGCKKGDKCNFTHPKLCWQAMGDGWP